ncbi:MAG: winged helix-turn-helix domain-containing protein [Thermoproteota archaeon]
MNKPDLRVVARLIEILYVNGSMKKTYLQMRAGLNYNVFKEYLKWMLERGLIDRIKDDEGEEKIELTDKGIEAYSRFVAWVKEMMQGLPL